MKHLFCRFFVTLFLVIGLCAEVAASEAVVKLNAAYAVMGIINPAIEVSVADHFSVQLEVVVSPWQGYINDAPLLFTVGIIEGRWYPTHKSEGFFVGPSAGYGAFLMQRPDYWNTPYVQHGTIALIGIDLGYVWRVKKWCFELFLGGGYTHSIYEGYDTRNGGRYDLGEFPGKYNRSAEWMPYKAGLNIGYCF